MRRFNLDRADLDAEPERDGANPDGYRVGVARVHEAIGAELLAAKLYALAPGQSVCPYHYEHSDEEWLLVLDGAPTVRHPDGEDELEPGDVVCFPTGPAGAHKVTNNAPDATARVLIVSTHNEPAVVVYPDSDKIGVYTEDGRDDLMVRRESGVDYFDGERRDPSGPTPYR